MEKERVAKEAEEKEKAEKEKKIKEQFGDTNSQWEKDKTEIQNLAKEESKKDVKAGGDAEKPDNQNTKKEGSGTKDEAKKVES